MSGRTVLKKCVLFPAIVTAAFWGAIPEANAQPQELPRPTYANSLMISLEHSPADAVEVDYIKANLPFGLYAWPSFSVTHIDPALAWISDWTQADSGIADFKSAVDGYIAAARANNVKFHLVVCSGLARNIGLYSEAKTEDVRNAQWFNDNNLGTAGQVTSPEAMTRYIFGTFSRYGRKLRANLEAKSRAAFAFLKQRMDENPETFIAVSGWGEAELSDRRIDYGTGPQALFCDYSPFAVLEFRDWITHQGLYDDAAGIHAGQGWSGGGAKYQGPAGLAQFNAGFGTAFTAWNLRYFDWSLADDWDAVPEDGINNDPGRIPFAAYVQDGMRPASGAGFLAGGFDPPRTMTPGSAFYDLWNLFRETMVRNLTRDAAGWAVDEGIPSDRWYSHQIPADYLFGTKPDDPVLNSRYYSSASSLWTAGVAPVASVGATIYDIKFPPNIYNPFGWFARTTQYVFPEISGMAANWGILEYDPETYPIGLGVEQSPAPFILEQHLRAYSYSPHLINFWRWWDDTGEHRIKGMNKETALHDFIALVRDKARSTDLDVVFTPPRVIGLSGFYGVPGARLEVTGKIWDGEAWNWTDWGDFDHFKIYRGATADFTADEAHLIGTTTSSVYEDGAADYGGTHYYKWRAVNDAGVRGPASDPVMVSAVVAGVPVLSLNRSSLAFGLSQGGTATPAQPVLVTNAGAAGTALNWTAVSNQSWLQVLPAFGTGNGVIQISAVDTGLEPGTYAGMITVDDPQAADAPQTVSVRLDVYAPGADQEPFGSFDTPADQAQVASSVTVSGWVLDDIGVATVAIKRYPVESDPAGTVESDGLVFIGNATFVRGARPDVEGAHPDDPQADKAGWGYMLLTNFLPNQGNGTFILAAVAADSTGHVVRLGEKTIHVDNANAVLPFGAIDTPAQGGTASGALYYNFGWALTPLPASIPVNGSTIWVWVDGVPLGHPSYDHYRGDIAALFPGYANSLGAVGVYNLNPATMTNATHTIAWSVTDSLGRTDGIGSRYFDVVNVGAPAAPVFGRPLPAAGIAALPEAANAPVFVRRGYAAGSPAEFVPPGPDGTVRISLSVSGMVSVYLTENAAAAMEIEMAGRVGRIPHTRPPSPPRYEAFLLAGGELRPLPVGAAFAPDRGTLSWQPGPAFRGEFTFLLVDMETMTKRTVKIAIE